MPPKKGTKSKGKGKAKAATAKPIREAPVPVQEVDTVEEREKVKHAPMEVDSAPVEEVKPEEPAMEAAPTASEAKPGMTSHERAQKLEALRAKLVCHYQVLLCINQVGCLSKTITA